MAAERNFFHRWRGMTTIGYELGVIWEMSVKLNRNSHFMCRVCALRNFQLFKLDRAIKPRINFRHGSS